VQPLTRSQQPLGCTSTTPILPSWGAFRTYRAHPLLCDQQRAFIPHTLCLGSLPFSGRTNMPTDSGTFGSGHLSVLRRHVFARILQSCCSQSPAVIWRQLCQPIADVTCSSPGVSWNGGSVVEGHCTCAEARSRASRVIMLAPDGYADFCQIDDS